MSDSTRVHDAVVDVLTTWEHPVTNRREFVRRLAAYLEEELADRDLNVDVDRPARGPCDIRVDDVGIVVFMDFSHSSTTDLQSKSDVINAEYDALVVFGYRLPERDLDRWRMGEVKHEALGLQLDDVTFLRRDPETETVESAGWPSRLWRFAEAVVALLSIVIGIELAVLYRAFGGPVPGAGVTLVAVLVLSAVLVLLYERIGV